VIILEGLTGVGKTSTIEALKRVRACQVIPEERTFGDFMIDFDSDPENAVARAADRLHEILDELIPSPRDRIVLERFYFSFTALGANPVFFTSIEQRLSDLDCTVVVLTIPDRLLASRSLYRSEYDRTDWQSLCSRYGSEAAALEALRQSQAARLAAIKSSRLPYREIDTSAMRWHEYALDIANSVC
jgi:hypothetical protein